MKFNRRFKLFTAGLVTGIALIAFAVIGTGAPEYPAKDRSSFQSWDSGFASPLYAAPDNNVDAKAKKKKKKKKLPGRDEALRRCAAACELACRDQNGCDRAHLIGGTKCKYYCKAGGDGEAPIRLPK